jgi:hypothetical protein
MKTPYTYYITKNADQYFIMLQTPPPANLTSPQHYTVGSGLLKDKKGYEEACRMVTFANAAVRLNSLLETTEDAIQSTEPTKLIEL